MFVELSCGIKSDKILLTLLETSYIVFRSFRFVVDIFLTRKCKKRALALCKKCLFVCQPLEAIISEVARAFHVR
jgi:hypothetical protein